MNMTQFLPRWVQVSTSGTLQLERRRPVDVLWAILEERSPPKLDAFFRAFGAAEAACMCYQLAAAPLAAVPAVRLVGLVDSPENFMVAGSVRCCFNMLCCFGMHRETGRYMISADVPEPTRSVVTKQHLAADCREEASPQSGLEGAPSTQAGRPPARPC